MAQAKITEKATAALKAAAQRERKPLWLWETDIREFGTRASPSGSLRYVFQTWEGRMRGQGPAHHRDRSRLGKARIEAQTNLVETNKGELTSPKQEQLKIQREQLQRKTISEAVSLYPEESKEREECTALFLPSSTGH